MRVPGNYSFRDASEATRALLSGRTPPDAILCANDLMALAAINVAHGEFGSRVGKDVSMKKEIPDEATFRDCRALRHSGFSLSDHCWLQVKICQLPSWTETGLPPKSRRKLLKR
jgi:hypothetical protein